MPKPKQIDITDEDWPESGITIIYVKNTKTLHISGWYDSCVSIESRSMSLAEFGVALGIEELRPKQERA